MSKWTSFATGMGEGYLAGKRYQDTKERADKQDKIWEKLADARIKADSAKANPAEVPVTPAPSLMAEEDEPIEGLGASMVRPRRYAHGGMVGEMPNHFDKMGWQRQTFKK